MDFFLLETKKKLLETKTDIQRYFNQMKLFQHCMEPWRQTTIFERRKTKMKIFRSAYALDLLPPVLSQGSHHTKTVLLQVRSHINR